MTQPEQDTQQADGTAQADQAKSKADEGGKDRGVNEPTDDLVTTEHSIAVDGPDGASAELKYSVTTGRIVLRREGHTDDKFDGPQPKAEVFVTAYTVETANP